MSNTSSVVRVFVVSFAPNSDDGVGGFNWFRVHAHALAHLATLCSADSAAAYDYRLSSVDVPLCIVEAQGDNGITRHIDWLQLL